MNIFFHSNIGRKGNEFYAKEVFVNYLENLSKKENIFIITPISEEKLSFHTQNLNTEKIRVIELPNSYLSRVKLICRQVKKENISLIFMPTYTGVIAAFISFIFKKKYILYHGTDWKLNTRESLTVLSNTKRKLLSFTPFLNNFFDSLISKKSAALLVTGGQLKKKYDRWNDDVFETKPIINLQNFSDDNTKVSKVDSKEYKLLFVGSLKSQKGIYDLLEAFIMLNPQDNFKLTIIGEGVEEKGLKTIIKQNNLQDRINLKGFIKNGPELFREYRQADVLILPSYSEGFPRVFYEAMYFNTAIITTAVNSIPYMLDDEKNALFIKQGNPEDIKNKIIRLFEDPSLLNRLKTNGKLLVDEVLREPVWDQHSRLIEEYLR
ncbi:glycosyltransferase involved in cell wall biosynthesis [Christiangramia gaetbulicola]|uniref:Glycosyltransferase involved in cell wall biosynthesis n=1 Tax=Christiangramia gaetbulicola TaxID=703340 RepID=A0A2T6AKY5_9FLAO|nr:glycosyltransferase [Christiangramia gaetbulicola]PTX44482.1 glycosyltransferase involved in cell wall biosynthesis [Christiangramia gaetbulicola]